MSAQDKTNGRRFLPFRGGQAEFVILPAFGWWNQLQAQGFGRARERFPVGIDEALRRQREAEQPIERQARSV